MTGHAARPERPPAPRRGIAAGRRSAATRTGGAERPPARRRDRGAATIWVLTLGLVLLAAGVAGSGIGAARVARHEAAVAADLGALAGAARAVEGTDVACARAAQLARRNGGQLVTCVAEGLDIVVIAEVKVSPLPGITRTARAAARAGPARGP